MEIINENPIKNLIVEKNDSLKKELKRINKRSRTIDTGQFWSMIETFPLWIRRIFICGWCTGMREGEIINIRWKDVNMVERLIKLDANDTKEASSKTVGIEQELYEVLVEIQTESADIKKEDNVFLSARGRKVNQSFFCKKVRKYTIAAGYDDFKFHDLRHCHTVRKRREGFDKSVIKAQHGHSTDSMYDWYNKVDEAEIQDMAGFTQKRLDILKRDAGSMVDLAISEDISLGVVQAFICRIWREKVKQAV